MRCCRLNSRLNFPAKISKPIRRNDRIPLRHLTVSSAFRRLPRSLRGARSSFEVTSRPSASPPAFQTNFPFHFIAGARNMATQLRARSCRPLPPRHPPARRCHDSGTSTPDLQPPSANILSQGPVESQDSEVRDHLFLFYCNICELVGADSTQVRPFPAPAPAPAPSLAKNRFVLTITAQLLPLLLPCIAASLDPKRNQLSIEEVKSRDALPSIRSVHLNPAKCSFER